MHDLATLPKLGVGFPYQPGARSVIEHCSDILGFLEVSPELLCRETEIGGARAFEFRENLLTDALSYLSDRPVVAHGLELSIASATGWETAYIDLLDEFHRICPFVWHSEHLSFMQVQNPDRQVLHTGVPLPVPLTEEALTLIAGRAATLNERYGVPFLLENVTYYLTGLPADRGRDEIAFLNDLSGAAGIGLLLDLYNFHCNAVNFRFDAKAALSRLRLDRVVEIHVAGGASHDGFTMDVHSNIVPAPVWDLLDWVLPRAPNVCGVVYELMQEALPLIGSAGVREELSRARESWLKHVRPNTTPGRGACH